MIRRLLIANRGEIAVRVARTAREMGIETVAVYSDSDAGAFHVGQMPRAVSLGAGPARDTYLSIPRLLEAAREAGADAVHPGYGFLAENAAFARSVEAAGLTWVGPPASAMERMGDKLRSRAKMREAGVPVVPGSNPAARTDEELSAEARRIGFPLLVKASAGGGGKGMSRVDRPEQLPSALAEARRLSAAAFGDDTIYLEKLLVRPRHVEFQIFGDKAGHVLHLFERECSVQRRHQKIVEETPSPALDQPLRSRMADAAVEAGRAVGYVGAGTVELLLDEKRNFYFLEMNTRLQVEHPITEATLGIDLVRAQLEIAAGARLPDGWARLSPRGHAIELRLYAEDPVSFLPRTGEVLEYAEPSGPGVRVDSGIARGSRVGLEFDPLLAKLVSYGPDRNAAIERARRALADWVVLGVQTNAPLLSAVLDSEEFVSGRYATDLVSRLPAPAPAEPPAAAWIAAARALGQRPARHPAGAAEGPAAGVDPWAEPSGWRVGA
ncbi:MAG: acetyl-CoA carboxylase biotin carboxylase subunit [Thermoanaerobaculia bacterium]